MADAKIDKDVQSKKFKVIIYSGADEGDKGDVFLAHNYRSVLIKRDEEVEIDEVFVKECLENSVIETALRDASGKPILKEDGTEKTVKTPRFSYKAEPI